MYVIGTLRNGRYYKYGDSVYNEDIVRLYSDILDLLEFLFITFNENKKCKKGWYRFYIIG